MDSSLLLDMQSALIAMALVTPRVLVCFVIVPGFSFSVLTGMAKNISAMAIALPAALPTFFYVRETPPDMLLAAVLLFKEAGIGLMLGVMMAIPVWVVQSVASILDSQRAAVQVQASNSAVDRDASALGGMLLQAVVIVMMQAGLLIAMTRILIESYGVWPAFNVTPPFDPGHMDVLIKRFSEFFWYIIVYGAPVIIPLIFIEFGFAMIGVFASNLQVSFASAPIKSLTGLFILLVYWPTLSHYVSGDFARVLDLMASLLDMSPK